MRVRRVQGADISVSSMRARAYGSSKVCGYVVKLGHNHVLGAPSPHFFVGRRQQEAHTVTRLPVHTGRLMAMGGGSQVPARTSSYRCTGCVCVAPFHVHHARGGTQPASAYQTLAAAPGRADIYAELHNSPVTSSRGCSPWPPPIVPTSTNS